MKGVVMRILQAGLGVEGGTPLGNFHSPKRGPASLSPAGSGEGESARP